MKKTTLIAISAALAACGAVVTSGDNAADARQGSQRSRTHRPDPNAGLDNARAMASWDEGGAPGCFDPRLAGRERAVAERLGGVPCSATSQGAAGLAPGGDSWVGRYRGPFDGGQGEVVIALEPNRLYNVNMSVAGGGCSGQASGFNAPRGNVLTLHIQTGNQADGPGECRIAMTRQGNTLRVSESGSCMELHGMSCGFSGSATRRGAISAATPVRPAVQSASWIVGAWVARSVPCGGEGLIFNADGTYVTESESGSWSMAGNTLSLLPRETFVMGDPGSETPVRNPRPNRLAILSYAPRAFAVREASGRVWNMVRCR